MTKQYKITVNGKTYDVSVEEIKSLESSKAVSSVVSAPLVLNTNNEVKAQAPQVQKALSAAPIDENAVSVKAPMPGTVLSFNVSIGDAVSDGQVLVILEAMKMENEIAAPASGVVQSIYVEKGSSVVEGQVILQIK